MTIDKALFKRISDRIDSYREDCIRLQFGLSAIPALSPENGGDGELPKARFLAERLRELGFTDIFDINAPDSRVSSGLRPNLIARVPGKRTDRTVWIMTHLDIVPPGEASLWHSDPYQGFVKDGLVYGRGTEDNQQDMVASIFAAKAFLDEGLTPESGIGLAFVSDEETASRYGISHVLADPKNPFRKTDIIVVPDSGNEEGTMIEVAEKSINWLRFRTLGKQCHGSRPNEGINAFRAASYLAVALDELHQVFPAVDPFFDPPGSTFQPTKKEANVPNVNTIPGEDVFYLDSRILPQYKLAEVMAAINSRVEAVEKRFGVTIEITPVQQVEAPAATAHDAPVVLALAEAAREVYKVEGTAQGVGAGTVAAYFRKEDYPVAVWSRVLQKAHQPDEHCSLENMMGNAKVFAHLFLQTGR
jgi:succinyl-diaminopimelate desuccinylase